jgi:Spy/CpxP family protein refolding chaperone
MIRNRLAVVVAVFMLVVLAPPGRAQFTGYGAGGQFLLLNKSVQEELKLTGEQRSKLKGSVDKVLDEYQDKLSRLRQMDAEDRAALMAAITEKTNGIVTTVLDKDQVKRLRQIDLQQRGPMALYDPEVRKALNITEEQRGKLKALADEGFKQLHKAVDARDDKQAEAVVKAAMEKLDSLLTEDQKRTWKEMLGKPFVPKLERE